MKNTHNFQLIACAVIVLFSSYSFGQANTNPDFVSSLPSNIRADFLSELSKTYKNEPDKVYKAPDTSVEKMESELEKLKLQLEKFEQKYNDNPYPAQLKPFGSSFFDTYQSTFMPINEPSFISDYILGPGDTLKVQFVGRQNDLLSLVIRRDGSVLIPTIGSVNVAGLSLDSASKLIATNVEQKILGTEAYVNLTNLRDINVLVIGNVNMPGMYTVSGGSNVLSLLNIAGGINENGSYRNISIKRNGKVISKVDLYDAFIEGDLFFSTLESGDSIIVNSVLPTVSISGGVSRPAIFEINETDSLDTVISYAGGILPGFAKDLSIHRQSEDGTTLLSIDKSEFDGYQLAHGDSIKISMYSPASKLQKSIFLSGEVKRPGKYNIRDGETLSEVLARAGGYTNNAYELSGKLLRESAKEIEREINTRIYNDMIKFIATSPLAKNIISGGGGSSALPLILSEFKNVEASGRVAAEFDLSKLRKNPQLDTILSDGDKIHIPAYSQEIYVLGEVVAPGTRLYEPSSTIAEYLAESGGIGAYGDKGRIIVIRPNGSAYIYKDNIFRRNSLNILPGSVIYVPREIGELDGINLAAVVAPIFSSLAISLASLNSINSN